MSFLTFLLFVTGHICSEDLYMAVRVWLLAIEKFYATSFYIVLSAFVDFKSSDTTVCIPEANRHDMLECMA
jgi:hypothetical protein